MGALEPGEKVFKGKGKGKGKDKGKSRAPHIISIGTKGKGSPIGKGLALGKGTLNGKGTVLNVKGSAFGKGSAVKGSAIGKGFAPTPLRTVNVIKPMFAKTPVRPLTLRVGARPIVAQRP